MTPYINSFVPGLGGRPYPPRGTQTAPPGHVPVQPRPDMGPFPPAVNPGNAPPMRPPQRSLQPPSDVPFNHQQSVQNQQAQSPDQSSGPIPGGNPFPQGNPPKPQIPGRPTFRQPGQGGGGFGGGGFGGGFGGGGLPPMPSFGGGGYGSSGGSSSPPPSFGGGGASGGGPGSFTMTRPAPPPASGGFDWSLVGGAPDPVAPNPFAFQQPPQNQNFVQQQTPFFANTPLASRAIPLLAALQGLR